MRLAYHQRKDTMNDPDINDPGTASLRPTSPPARPTRKRAAKPAVARKPRQTKPRRYAVQKYVPDPQPDVSRWADVPTGFDAPTADECRAWLASDKPIPGETYRIIAILAEGKVVEEVKTKRKFA